MEKLRSRLRERDVNMCVSLDLWSIEYISTHCCIDQKYRCMHPSSYCPAHTHTCLQQDLDRGTAAAKKNRKDRKRREKKPTKDDMTDEQRKHTARLESHAELHMQLDNSFSRGMSIAEKNANRCVSNVVWHTRA